MKQWIENLLKLQETDLRIRQLSTRRDMIPKEIDRIDKDIAADEEKLRKAKESDMATKMEIKQVESEIMKYNDEISKLQKQSAMVKKNDEYKALLKEIEHAKSKISEQETRELELMDKLDAVRKTINKEEKLLADRKRALLEEKEDLIELEQTIKAQIDKISAGREELLIPIELEVMDLYTRLIDKGVGTPLVEVHNGNCGNCHLKLIPQTVNMARKQDLVTCENCGHLLYMQD